MKKLLTVFLSLIICCLSFGITSCSAPQKDAVNVKYYQEAKFFAPLIISGGETIGLIPEPAATNLQKNALKQGKTIYRLDLQELYDSEEKSYPQAVLMVKKSVLGEHADLDLALSQKIGNSVLWAKANVDSAITAISNMGATTLDPDSITPEVIDACNISWQSASDAKESVNKYINSIIDIDASKANKVADDFFYSGSSYSHGEQQSYSFITPDGAPALAISKLMHDNDDLSTGKTINYSVVQNAVMQNSLKTGGADFILAPVNLASKFYKTYDATNHYVMVAVITHGNFYIMSTEPLSSVDDLQGKQIAVPMMGAVPDWTLQMVLKKYALPINVIE